MKSHYSTVSVEEARRESQRNGDERFRPLVLIVDDEPIIAETLAAILNGSGLAAMTAHDSFDALEIAGLMPPEILIADVAMPGINGLDLAIEVSRNITACDVILFSEQTSTSDLAAKIKDSGHDFETLVKPVHPADLLARVFDRLSKRGCLVPSTPEGRAKSPIIFRLPGQYPDLLAQSTHVPKAKRTRPPAPTA